MITLAISGGTVAEIIGATGGGSTEDTNLNLTYNYPAPVQVAGFNQMTPCSPTDCRDTGSCEPPLPVFGNSPQYGSQYTNDVNTFVFDTGSGPSAQFSIQKLINGFWVTQVVISNSIYGAFLPLGSIPNNPTLMLFSVNWGFVYNHFSYGTYRVQVGSCSKSGTQASAAIAIPSLPGNTNIWIGTLTIGNVIIPVNYYGNWLGYLAYLAAAINAQGRYTAVVTGTGITISGTNYINDNGTSISYLLNDTIQSFYAEMAEGDLSIVNTGNPVINTTNPQGFNDIIYNINGKWNGSQYGGAIVDPIQIFAGSIDYVTLARVGDIFYNSNIVSTSITVTLKFNGVPNFGAVDFVQSQTNTPGLPQTFNFSFLCNGIGANPPTVSPGTIVSLEVSVEAASGGPQAYAEILGGSFYNVSQKTASNTLATLAGGTAYVYTCTCTSASHPVMLRAWNCDLARGTIKFESYITGTVGDAYNPGNFFTFNGLTLFDSIRLPGFFGNAEFNHNQIKNVWGQSLTEKMGTVEVVRDEIIPKYICQIKPVPLWAIKSLEYYGLMANIKLLVSDYNYNNADWNIQQKQVVLKGNFKPKYLNKAHESVDKMYYNRQLVYEGTFEEGIQSGIMSNADI